MKLKLFSVQSGNRKTQLDKLESDVNDWLAEQRDIVVENSYQMSQPNVSWTHLVLAVWYSEK